MTTIEEVESSEHWRTSDFPLPLPKEDDLGGFPKRSTLLHEVQEAERSSIYYRNNKVTGYTFGRGGDFSIRVYDKTEELRFRIDDAPSVKARIAAEEKAAREAEVWAQNGWQEGEPVTRIEVQVRGAALDELCKRCETKVRKSTSPEDYEKAVDEACEAMCDAFEESLDEIWGYATKKWLRHTKPSPKTGRYATRGYRCPESDFWLMVQAISFVRANAPIASRVRRRSVVRSSQTLGSVLSLITYYGEHCPWIDTINGEWKLPDESRCAAMADLGLGGAVERLRGEVARALEAAAPLIVRDLIINAGSPKEALERLIVRWGAATCRFAPARVEDPKDGKMKVPREDGTLANVPIFADDGAWLRVNPRVGGERSLS